MKIFYLIKTELDETATRILKTHQTSHEVTRLDLWRDKNYAKIVEMIEDSDRVISW